MHKRTTLALGIATLALMALAFVPHVHAVATDFTILDSPASVGLGSADLKETVINIIKWILGILALLAVALIIYGGFMWMTSAGNEDRIEKGKKIISAAIVGLIIIILAWAIVIFVANTTKNVTTGA